jgi:SAM-dependent methyltransferase
VTDDRSLVAAVERYYTAKLATHGPTPAGVDWNGTHGQTLRFEQLLAVLGEAGSEPSINDFGCGYGGLLDVLSRRLERFEYRGFDVSEAMIAAARERYGGDRRARFVTDERDLAKADFTIASGVFNVRVGHGEEVWRRYVLSVIDRLAALSCKGMAFNALTIHSDPDRMSPDLYYADPAELLDHCLRLHSRDVALRHDYGLYEFTVIVRVDGRPPVAGRERSAGA